MLQTRQAASGRRQPDTAAVVPASAAASPGSELDHAVAAWVAGHPLSPPEVDCALAVMLKILDGKCKMGDADRRVMAALYRAVRQWPGERLPATLHGLVERATADTDTDTDTDAALRQRIYEQRVLAETVISRPVMKGFKARIRAHGLFAVARPALEQLRTESVP